MHRFRAPFSEPDQLNHTRSWAACITITSGFRFSVHTGGSLTNGFAPTTTLGCGSWGGNSISENLDYKHLMNVSRIGKVITSRKVPTDAEISPRSGPDVSDEKITAN
jgi:hypothetical protein